MTKFNISPSNVRNKEIKPVRLMTYHFPLRADVDCDFFAIPADLTHKEAKKLSKFIETLAIKN